MKPATFQYLAPDNLQGAIEYLSENAPDANLLAGGQSLVPMMNFRLARPKVLIDLNLIPELAFIREDKNHLVIGAMTRERDIENDKLVHEHSPLLHRATLNIGHLPIRSRGTIGGSIANADPAAEYPAVILALDASLKALSVRGAREIPAAEFFEGALSTALDADEILTEIRIPKAPEDSGAAFEEIARRKGDFALAGVAAQVTLKKGIVKGVRVAACGVGAGPIRLRNAEEIVREQSITDELIAAAEHAASAEVEPEGDVHATADYRRKLAGIMTRRAILKAIECAKGPE